MTWLSLDSSAPHRRRLDFLCTLPELRWLVLGGWARPRLDPLRRLSHLKGLNLYEAGAPRGGLDALVHALPNLEWLGLFGCRWVSDLAPLTRLAALEELELRGTAVDDCAPLSGLPGLRRLRIGGSDRLTGLDAVARMPSLRMLYLWDVDEEVDLSAFAGRRLTIELLGGVRATGTERLGPGVRIIRRR